MRARNIKPGFFKNELLGTVDPLVSLLFAGLWCLADRDGRLEDRPLRIKAEIFPYRENLDVNGELTVLERMGFIQRYKVGEVAVIQICNFAKHQAPHHTEKKSILPAPVNSPLEHGENPPDSLIPDSPIPDSPIPEPSPFSQEDFDRSLQKQKGFDERDSRELAKAKKTVLLRIRAMVGVRAVSEDEFMTAVCEESGLLPDRVRDLEQKSKWVGASA